MNLNKSEFQTGWGLNLRTRGFSTNRIEELILKCADQKGRGAIPSGLSRSYGDSSLNSGGYRISSSLYKDLNIDETTGIAECGSGVLIRELEYSAYLKGYLPPIVPGTSLVTLGGAFASDIHGKSQQLDGNFSNHVEAISIINAQGIEKKYQQDSEEFRATAGGMGLTGFISKLWIKLRKVEIPLIFQEEIRVKNLAEMFSTLLILEQTYPYTVAWIDLSGKYLGRGVISCGRFASKSDMENINHVDFGIKPNPKTFSIPLIGKVNIMRKFTIRIFNTFWYRRPLKKGLISFPKFMHPLDSIGNWNKIYGKSGFIQYQFVIPDHHREVLFQILGLLKQYKVSSFLTVLKKFGQNGSGYLSFPIPGWTLAMDFSSDTPNLRKVIDELDNLVIKSEGRIYLTKDSTSTPQTIEKMYLDLSKWRIVKRKMDPSNFWQSDQSRRLNLC